MPKKIIACLCLFVLLFPALGCTYSPSAAVPTNNHTYLATTENTEDSVAETAHIQPQTAPTEPETGPTEPIIEVLPANAWTPLCNEYIYLRSAPSDANSIAKIPVGVLLNLEKWQGKYALVTYKGTKGYVSSNYIKPADEDYFARHLQVVSPTVKYTYEQMLNDMERLNALYPSAVQTDVIGKSELGQDIPVIRIGNPQAKYHVLMQGAIHGREHFTAWLLMAIADYALLQNHLADGDVCYHIIPMANPDGVAVSQRGKLNAEQWKIYQSDLLSGHTTDSETTYATQWKANALGVDLNRNFPAGWDVSQERTNPSTQKYPGSEPFSAAESKALRDYTLAYSFDATISFHSHGSVIFYRYGDKQPVNDLSYGLALAVKAVVGYPLMLADGTTGAGYKDWAIDALGIPSLTLEIGSGTTPIEQRDMYNIFARFKDILPVIADWLL